MGQLVVKIESSSARYVTFLQLFSTRACIIYDIGILNFKYHNVYMYVYDKKKSMVYKTSFVNQL